MKQYVNAHDIANTIRMTRSRFKGSFLIVEGDSDARMYRRFSDKSSCRVIPALGKTNALGAMTILNEDAVPGVLAVVDSDFWRLDDDVPETDNVLITDTHDLETMILNSPALDIALEEFGSDRRIKRVSGTVRDLILRAVLPLGYVRWLAGSGQEKAGFQFRHMSFASFVVAGTGTLEIDLDRLLVEVTPRSHGEKVDRAAIKRRVRKLISDSAHDPWQVCRGHDMITILAIGFREVFGNRDAKRISDDQIDRIMRLSFGYLAFSRTKLYEAIREWEDAHQPYTVLVHDPGGPPGSETPE
jgi:RNase P protein component